jgi:hypothetical protein
MVVPLRRSPLNSCRKVNSSIVFQSIEMARLGGNRYEGGTNNDTWKPTGKRLSSVGLLCHLPPVCGAK